MNELLFDTRQNILLHLSELLVLRNEILVLLKVIARAYIITIT